MKTNSSRFVGYSATTLLVWARFSVMTFLLIGGLGLLSGVAQKKKKTEEKTAEQMAEAEFQFSEGMRFYITEEYQKAIPFFEKALETLPDNPGINYSLAQTYEKLGEVEKSQTYALKAYQQEPTNKYYGFLLADLQAKQKNFAEAEKIYKTFLEQFPNEIGEHGIELAAIYLLQNKYDDALKVYDKVEKALGVSEEITRQKQLILLRQNRIDDVIKEAEKLVASDPNEMDYLVELAQLLMTNDRNDQAQNYLEKVIKNNPDNAQAHVMLAELFRKKGDINRCNKELDLAFGNPALDGLTKSRILASYVGMLSDNDSRENAFKLAKDLVKNYPFEPKAHLIYADLLIQRNSIAEARDAYVRAARLDKSVYEVWARIVDLDGRINQIDSLVVHAEEAIEIFPNQPSFWVASGSGYLIKRDYNRSIEALEEARRLFDAGGDDNKDPKTIAFVCGGLGDAYNSVGKHQKSDAAYEAALRAEPDNDHVLNNYSYFLALRKENLPRAVELSARLVERFPNNSTYLDTYSWVLYVNKDYAKAKIYLEKAVANNTSNNGVIIEHYGDVLYQLGEKEKALEQWKKAKLLGHASTLIDRKIATGQLVE
ncbi:MAG: tetratricopeptide repeat protein [Spirosomataceae bacterium]